MNISHKVHHRSCGLGRRELESFGHTKDEWGMDGEKDKVDTIPLAVPERERPGHGDLRWLSGLIAG